MKRSQFVAGRASSIVALSIATALVIAACGRHDLRSAASDAARRGQRQGRQVVRAMEPTGLAGVQPWDQPQGAC